MKKIICLLLFSQALLSQDFHGYSEVFHTDESKGFNYAKLPNLKSVLFASSGFSIFDSTDISENWVAEYGNNAVITGTVKTVTYSNGVKVARFDGTASTWFECIIDTVGLSSEYTIVLVASCSPVTGRYGLFTTRSNGLKGIQIEQDASSAAKGFIGDGVTYSSPTYGAAGSYSLSSIIWKKSADDSTKIYVNGDFKYVVKQTVGITYKKYRIGNRFVDIDVSSWKGDVGAVIVCASSLPNSTLVSILKDLETRFKISQNLSLN